MLASLALLQTLVRQARHEMAATILPTSPLKRIDPPVREEQRELDQWLFDRDSRWQR